MENWRSVPGFDGLYKIDISTKEGRCWSCYTNKCLSNKPYKHTSRINWLLYGRNGKAVFQQAARWIAITYPELVQNEYFEGAEIDHIIPLSAGGTNHPTNLRWVTHKENLNNPLTKQHRSKAQINRQDLSKPVIQYDLNGNYINDYPSAREAERKTGVDRSNISACCNGRLRVAGTRGGPKYIWKYE